MLNYTMHFVWSGLFLGCKRDCLTGFVLKYVYFLKKWIEAKLSGSFLGCKLDSLFGCVEMHMFLQKWIEVKLSGSF